MIRCSHRLQQVFSNARTLFISRQSSSKLDIENLEKESALVDVIDEDAKQLQEQLELKRNKSRLKEHDRRLLHEQNPYPEPQFWYHGTLKYNRRLYGRYGQASGVNPSICWPTETELKESLEYERVAYPFTIPQMMEEAKRKRQEKREKTLKRQEEIVKRMEKLETWKKELHDKIAKKEAEMYAAKQRKEKLIEEVRRHFGYTVDPKDDRFKEMLEKKEKEQKKAMKEAKKKAKEEKMLAKMLGKEVEDEKKSKEGESKPNKNSETNPGENVDQENKK